MTERWTLLGARQKRIMNRRFFPPVELKAWFAAIMFWAGSDLLGRWWKQGGAIAKAEFSPSVGGVRRLPFLRSVGKYPRRVLQQTSPLHSVYSRTIGLDHDGFAALQLSSNKQHPDCNLGAVKTYSFIHNARYCLLICTRISLFVENDGFVKLLSFLLIMKDHQPTSRKSLDLVRSAFMMLC